MIDVFGLVIEHKGRNKYEVISLYVKNRTSFRYPVYGFDHVISSMLK
jgi:hypothetical protein